jgi:hypothetical protein
MLSSHKPLMKFVVCFMVEVNVGKVWSKLLVTGYRDN